MTKAMIPSCNAFIDAALNVSAVRSICHSHSRQKAPIVDDIVQRGTTPRGAELVKVVAKGGALVHLLDAEDNHALCGLAPQRRIRTRRGGWRRIEDQQQEATCAKCLRAAEGAR